MGTYKFDEHNFSIFLIQHALPVLTIIGVTVICAFGTSCNEATMLINMRACLCVVYK